MGFRLSKAAGFDADLDFNTLTRNELGRRVDRVRPANSLFLLKGTGSVPHQGGVRLKIGEPAYETLLRWVAEGCKDAGPTLLEKLEVSPDKARLASDKPTQQLTVRAHFYSGEVRDVTALSVFSVNVAGAATVSDGGFVEFNRTGDAAILVRYLDQIKSARLQYVRTDPKFVFRPPVANASGSLSNEIDKFVFAKQKELQLNPRAPLCTDEGFSTPRLSLDTIECGLPTANEAREFLDSKDAQKRAKLIDKLLDRDEYAAFWGLKWADVLRGSPTTISERGVHSFHRYLVQHHRPPGQADGPVCP